MMTLPSAKEMAYSGDDALATVAIEDLGGTNINAKTLFPAKRSDPALYVKLEKRILNFIKKTSDNVRSGSKDLVGNFGRMFYLSAVTITTVGFGDIVPLTGRARSLVAIEAILGIVIIGMFINSVGQKE
jgi:hypothetical protein